MNHPTIIFENGKKFINSLEFHSEVLKLRKSDYIRNIKHWFKSDYLFQNEYEPRVPVLNKDFTALGLKSTGGRPTENFLISLELSKLIAVNSESDYKKEYVKWLLSLESGLKTGLLVTHEQVLQTIKMVKIFAIYEYRKEAQNRNLKNYIFNHSEINEKFIYSYFHKWRNEALNLGKEELHKRIVDYCLLERRRLPNFKNKDEMLTFLHDHEQIKNAVWDLLSSQNQSAELVQNICNLAQEIAKEMKPYLQRLNESDLFFTKIDTAEIKSIL